MDIQFRHFFLKGKSELSTFLQHSNADAKNIGAETYKVDGTECLASFLSSFYLKAHYGLKGRRHDRCGWSCLLQIQQTPEKQQPG